MPPLPRKQAVALDLLERTSVFVHLDPRRPGVIVPQGFLKQPQLVLQIGLNMAIAIPHLEVGDEGISCTLSFNRSPFWCRIPWGSVYALVGDDGRGMVWPNDVPPEVATQMQKAATPAAAKAGKKPKPKLAAVKSGERDSKPPGGHSAKASPEVKPFPSSRNTATLAMSSACVTGVIASARRAPGRDSR